MPVMVNWHYPSEKYGWICALYQRFTGRKYWRLCHAEILTSTGIYSYSFKRVSLGTQTTTTLGQLINVDNLASEEEILKNATDYYYDFGDATYSGMIFGGVNCVEFVKYVLNVTHWDDVTTPAELYQRLYEYQHKYEVFQRFDRK